MVQQVVTGQPSIADLMAMVAAMQAQLKANEDKLKANEDKLAATEAKLKAKQTAGYNLSTSISENGNFSVKLKGQGMPISRKWQDWEFLLSEASVTEIRTAFEAAKLELQALDADPEIQAKRAIANAKLAEQRRTYAQSKAGK